MAEERIKVESFWTRRSGLLAFIITLAAFCLGMLQDIFLTSEGFTRWSLIVLSNMITGLIAGALFYQFAAAERNRREFLRERMQTIAELNHHIRNALQVIKFWGAQHQNCTLDEMQIQLMRESVDRIEWALREVLPKYPISAGGMLGHPAAHPELPQSPSAAEMQQRPGEMAEHKQR